ncbi:MAG: protoheme IX farnesyltransferase [Rickettsiales bacterium]|nr:protoheme IX farnesyltransferase [Rickettsiales bacterium]
MTAFSPTLHADASVRELLSLLKPRVLLLVVFTGAVGMALAPGSLHPATQAIILFAIALGSGAGGMINMWYDRDIDAIMSRTAQRPIPMGKVAPDDVLIVGIMLALLATGILGLATNWAAAGLLAFAIWFYAVFYTMWLKRSTPQNIVIGGAAGAFPPVIGWLAATGSVSIEPLILFAIIFLWTPPHFWALALHRNQDYQNAKVPMYPVMHGTRATLKAMAVYSVLLAVVSLLPIVLGYNGPLYAIGAIGCNGWFLHLMYRVWRANGNSKQAMQLFGYSIGYLFAIFLCLWLDHSIY